MAQHRPPFAGAAFDVVVVAASAGGLQALSALVSALPADFPAGVVVVQHLPDRHPSLMPAILGRRTGLVVCAARAGDRVQPGTVYVAPPGRHLLLRAGLKLAQTDTQRIHYVRPSADILFESAAACGGARVVGVVLTGTGSDGNMGVTRIKQAGGTVVVQDPETAEFDGMPRAALATGCFDLVLPLDEIAPALCRLVRPVPA